MVRENAGNSEIFSNTRNLVCLTSALSSKFPDSKLKVKYVLIFSVQIFIFFPKTKSKRLELDWP